MAGHSKWANIRFRKAAQDARRGRLFTKLIREITVAARSAGGDLASNPRLRAAVDKALAANMARETIDRATKRGTGEIEGVEYDEVRYEGYATGGVAVLVECATDNRNRTVSEIRHVFTKYGGSLGTDGSVGYMFTKTGVFLFAPGIDEELVMEVAVKAGAEDIETNDDGSIEVMTVPSNFEDISMAFKEVGLKPELAEVLQRPSNDCPLTPDDAERVKQLVDRLEELEDVQEVFTNASFPEEVQSAT